MFVFSQLAAIAIRFASLVACLGDLLCLTRAFSLTILFMTCLGVSFSYAQEEDYEFVSEENIEEEAVEEGTEFVGETIQEEALGDGDYTEGFSEADMLREYGIQEADIAQQVTEGVRIEDIVESESEYQYSSHGRGDPFVPPLTIEIKDEVAEDTGELLIETELQSVLQQFPLDSLKVVGIWRTGNKSKALVTTPKDEGVVVETGDFMGYRGGTVLSITEDHLKVREFELLEDGTRLFKDSKIFLQGHKPVEKGKIVYKAGLEPEVIVPETENDVKEEAPAENAGKNAKGVADAAKKIIGEAVNPDIGKALDVNEQKVSGNAGTENEAEKPVNAEVPQNETMVEGEK